MFKKPVSGAGSLRSGPARGARFLPPLLTRSWGRLAPPAVFRRPQARLSSLTNRPPLAPARQQGEQCNPGGEPNRPLNCEGHGIPPFLKYGRPRTLIVMRINFGFGATAGVSRTK